MPKQKLSTYREIVKLLAEHHIGIALDRTCPHCKYPEMGALLHDGEPLGIHTCRKCGYSEV